MNAAVQQRKRPGYIKTEEIAGSNEKNLGLEIDNRENLVYNDPEHLSAWRQFAFLALMSGGKGSKAEWKGA